MKHQFVISGKLKLMPGGHLMRQYAVITETGIRDESPLGLEGVRQCESGPDGSFESHFTTKGKGKPGMIEVHIQFEPGVWACREVNQAEFTLMREGTDKTEIDLGEIEVDRAACRKPSALE